MSTVNPTTFTITDPNVTAEGVTSFDVDLGTKSGAYTLTASVPVSSVTVNATAGTYTGTISSLHESLAPGTWYCACRAVNAAGVSLESAETTFVIQAVPSAPTGFTVA